MADANHDKYFNRYAASPEPLLTPADATPGLIITIPACRENRLEATLRSLLQCDTCCYTEVLVLLNHISDAPDQVKKFHRDQLESMQSNPEFSGQEKLTFQFILKELPPRHAGVGLARKLLMDEALRRISDDGIIVALDADCTVRSDYLTAIHREFQQNPHWQGASIAFEHNLSEAGRHVHSVASYELHLRYYVEAQRYIALPYAYHTVGSCMAVRPTTYARVGGMNRRKAGEDFYFLQKVIPHGFGEINSTRVYPSGRESDRVPFGTGRAVMEFNNKKRQPLSYNPKSIMLIKNWIEQCGKADINQAAEILPAGLLENIAFTENLNRILKQSTSKEIFSRHFFHWFDGFLLMKSLHYLRDHNFPDIATSDAACWLLNTRYGIDAAPDTFALLDEYRKIQGISLGR